MKMNLSSRRFLSTLLSLALLCALALPAGAALIKPQDAALSGTSAYVYKTVKSPQVGSIGGEWAVLGLARSGYDVPESYYQSYYATVEKYVEACKGVLHDKKYTEYSRIIVALSAIGKDARDVAGYDLTKALGDYEKTIWQGMNGPIWALIALDSADYPMPRNPEAKTQATRELYVRRILDCRLSDGGWSLFGGTDSATSGDAVSDPDITGMALQALARYQDRADVKKATDEALDCLSKMQDKNGGYGSWGVTNSESVVQVLVALTELGIPLDDARFVKNGNTVLDNLLTYRQSDGSFVHAVGGSGNNQMSTEQGLYALAAASRAGEGKASLYRMSDALSIPDAVGTGPVQGEGLAGKNADVKSVPIAAPGTTFSDVAYSETITAIEALAARGILGGRGDGTFDPNASMTRAEFAKVIVTALGLTPKAVTQFTDVSADAWYAGFVGTAYTYGIVTGTSGTTFTPSGTITRQEATVMAARAARLCGMDTAMDDSAVRDMLAQFGDYTTAADWARPALAFCYSAGILNQEDLDIRPAAAITRAEVSQMLFELLGGANLL